MEMSFFLVSKPPTSYPSSTPTYSHLPTSIPTSIPTSMPSAPTSQPTTTVQTQLVLPGIAVISGVNASSFDADYETSFEEGMAHILTSQSSHNFEGKHVSVVTVTDVTRRFLMTRRLDGSSSVNVFFQVSIIVEQFGFSVDEVISIVSNQIKSSVDGSSALQDAINSRLSSYVGSGFTALSITSISVQDEDATLTPLRTAAPTPSPSRRSSGSGGGGSGSKDLSEWQLGLVVSAAVVIGVGLIILTIVYFRSRGSKDSGNRDPQDSPRLWSAVQVDVRAPSTDVRTNFETADLDELRHRSVKLEENSSEPNVFGGLLSHVFKQRSAPVSPAPTGPEAPMQLRSFDSHELQGGIPDSPSSLDVVAQPRRPSGGDPESLAITTPSRGGQGFEEVAL